MYNPYFSRENDLLKGIISNLIEIIRIFLNNKYLAKRNFNFYHIAWKKLDISYNNIGAFILLKWILENGFNQILLLKTIIYNKCKF